MAEPTVSSGSVPRLRRDDLTSCAQGAAPRRMLCRLLAADVRRTQQGQSWATLELSWRGRTIRAVVFPRAWRALRAVPDLEVGRSYVVVASVGFRDGAPVLDVHEVHELLLHLVAADDVGAAH